MTGLLQEVAINLFTRDWDDGETYSVVDGDDWVEFRRRDDYLRVIRGFQHKELSRRVLTVQEFLMEYLPLPDSGPRCETCGGPAWSDVGKQAACDGGEHLNDKLAYIEGWLLSIGCPAPDDVG